MIFNTVTRITLILAIIVAVSDTDTCIAIPKFGVEYKQNCALCHHNADGGGIRTLYGAQFFSNMKLPLDPVEDFSELEKIKPVINENLQFGADFRSMYYSTWKDLESNSFMTMQSDLYLAISPNDKTLIYIEKSISRNSFEAFAQFQGLPYSGVIKAGRFIPAYGWRFSDHKTYVRDYLGFSQYPMHGVKVIEDQGVEGGIYREAWESSIAITNGSNSQVDNDQGKAITGRLAIRGSGTSANYTVGASFRHEVRNGSDDLLYFGGFWGRSLGKIIYIGEADIVRDGDTGSLTATHLLTYHFRKGWDLNLGYDFHDPDLEYETGYNWRGKLSSEIYLTGYMELVPTIEWNYEESLSGEREYGNVELQLHLWF